MKTHNRNTERLVLASIVLIALLAGTGLGSPFAQGAVANGDFEKGFENGVAEGWEPFNRRGATFRENAALGPIGGGIYGASHGKEDERNIALNGKVYVVDAARIDVVGRLQEALGPTVITIAKLNAENYLRGEPLYGDAYQNGQRFADYCCNESEDRNLHAHCYYGLNEPDINSRSGLAAACRFELGFTRRLHEHGMRSIVLNHSVGTPADPDNMLMKEMRELLAEADYVGYHAFGSLQPVASGGQLLCGTDSLAHYSLRWRKYADEYTTRGWRFPPVIYTQAGTWGGWRENPDLSPEDITWDLIKFAEYMRDDPWNIGMCAFVTGAWTGQPWKKWDLSEYPELIKEVGMDNWLYPVDAHAGQGAQLITGNSGRFDGGIVQKVATLPGHHHIRGQLKWEFSGGWPGNGVFRVGWDPTGQTSNPDAPTVRWSDNLIRQNRWETDTWYPFEQRALATGEELSIWLNAAGTAYRPLVRVYVDEVRLTPVEEPDL